MGTTSVLQAMKYVDELCIIGKSHLQTLALHFYYQCILFAIS